MAVESDELRIVHSSINNHKHCTKYEEILCTLTHIKHVKIEPITLKPHNKPKPTNTYYGVRIVTGNQENAGTAAKVYLELTGDKARTGKIGLAHHIQFIKSSDATYDDYIVECEGDLGEIQLVTIGNDGLKAPHASWYVAFTYVINLKTQSEQNFPCYHWIGEGDHYTNSADCATLKQIGHNSVLVKQRRTQIEERQKNYVWKFLPEQGYPSAVNTEDHYNPPLDEKFESTKNQNLLGNRLKGFVLSLESVVTKGNPSHIVSTLVGKEVKDTDTIKSLAKFYSLAKSLKNEELKFVSKHHHSVDLYEDTITPFEASRWTSDVEFGRQILNGVNCVLVKRCTALPDNFPVTNEMVGNLLCRGVSLEQEMQDGYVYICDLSEIMDGLPCKEGFYSAAPLCLLYVNPTKRLVPIAIQLKRIPAEDNPIFLPTDGWIDWLLAKMYFANANAAHHQIASHYISCHAVMEAYGVATMRTLPDAHPLYKLLRPAFRYTMAINNAARGRLMNGGGTLDLLLSIGGKDHLSGKNKLAERTNEKYNVHWTNIKRNIVERGVDDPDKLPFYYYRDDGLKLWNAIESFVKSIIDLFYNEDTDVLQDTELKDWANEIHHYAFPAFRSQPIGRGFPEVITSKNELIEYCTLIIFTGTAQHAAVNFGQFQIYGYVPNAPFSLRRPVPTQKGIATEDDILHSLPTFVLTALSITIVFTFSQFSPDEIYLGGYPTMWYTKENEKACVHAFLESLANINADIIERNKKLEIPYKYLLPARCPNSVAI